MLLSNVVLSSPIMHPEGAPAGGGGGGDAGGDFAYVFTTFLLINKCTATSFQKDHSRKQNLTIFVSRFGINPEEDPELAMALRISMEEERARQQVSQLFLMISKLSI